MERAEVPSMSREQRLSEWIEDYSDMILRTCYVVVLEGEDIETAKERQAFSVHDFVQIAKEAVGVRYHLTSQQIALMSIDVDENAAYVLLDGTLCYRCWIFVGELSDLEAEQDGLTPFM